MIAILTVKRKKRKRIGFINNDSFFVLYVCTFIIHHVSN